MSSNPFMWRFPTTRKRKDTYYLGYRFPGGRDNGFAYQLDAHLAFTAKTATPIRVQYCGFHNGVPIYFMFTTEAHAVRTCTLPFWKNLWPTQYRCFPDWAITVEEAMAVFGCKSRKRLYKVLWKYATYNEWREREEFDGFVDASAVVKAQKAIEQRLWRTWVEGNMRIARAEEVIDECAKSQWTAKDNLRQLRALGIVA